MAEAAPAPELPDLVLNPDAVLGDEGVEWRHKRAPDYSKTRKFWAESKSLHHEPPIASKHPNPAD